MSMQPILRSGGVMALACTVSFAALFAFAPISAGPAWAQAEAADDRPGRGNPPAHKDEDAETRKTQSASETDKGPGAQKSDTPPGHVKKSDNEGQGPDKAPKTEAQKGSGRAQKVPDEYIVIFKSQASMKSDNEHRKHGDVLNEFAGGRAKLMKVRNPQALEALKKNKDIESVENNMVAEISWAPNDPYYAGYQWHLQPWSTKRGSNLTSGWNKSQGNPNQRIVIADTGLDWNHPEISGKAPLGYNFKENNGNWYDYQGHGTSVGGVAAAVTNNGYGGAGAEPSAKLYAAKIVAGDSGSSDYYTMGRAIYYSSQWSGTTVINMSFVGYGYSSYLCDMVNYARGRNVVVVASAGNDNTNAAAYPAACPGALGVGATNSGGTRASFSNWGQPNVDVSAPGQSILAPRTGYKGGGHHWVSGTSFSSPLVAGVTALTRARYPAWSEGTVRSRVQWSGWNPECGWACYTNNFGYGVVDAYWATY